MLAGYGTKAYRRNNATSDGNHLTAAAWDLLSKGALAG